MKYNKTIRFMLTAFLLGISAMPASAQKPESAVLFSIPPSTSEGWQHTQTIHGISISYSKIELNGKLFLTIRFENMTQNQLSFVWSLKRNQEQVVITNDEMTEARMSLAAAESMTFDGSYLIQLHPFDDPSSYTVNIQTTQR